MDSASLTLLAIASLGAIYYVLYRVVFYQKLKWKMIHSIWLPIVVILVGVVIAAGLLIQPATGGSMAELAAIVTLMVFASPALVFFAISLIGSWIDKRNKSQ